MGYSITSDRVNAERVGLLVKRLRDPRPVTLQAAEWVARQARRDAPRGKYGRRMAGLAASLHTVLLSDTSFVLASDKAYARVQNEGGTITPGSGPLAAKMLVMPLSAHARKYIGFLGAGTSLRDGPLKLFILKSRSGKLFLVRSLERVSKRLKRRDKRGRVKRAVSGKAKLEFMFALLPRAVIKPNPPPRGYAPRADEPAFSEFVGRRLRDYLKTGSV